ncbi:MAG: hypothetical protein VW547_15745, partial [Alphaproteobacteria bacterium]
MNDTPTPSLRATLEATGRTTLTRDDWLTRVAEVGPVAEAGAPQADRERMLGIDTMDALHSREMFRLLLPVALGGYELNLPDYF